MRIARLAGIPIRLHVSFLVVVAMYGAWSLTHSGIIGLIDTVFVAAALFGSVILHELGHALAARQFGIRTRDITLYPFGGVAALETMPKRPLHEFIVAIAGPAVNAVLFGLGFTVALATNFEFAYLFAALNFAMGVFNMIPAFPMDGGRVLRALLAIPFGYVRASRIAMTVGRAFAWVFITVGVVSWHLNLVLVGGFLLFAVSAERARLEAQLRGVSRDAWRGRPVRWHASR